MKNVCTHRTAVKLKDAGWVPPAVAPGQTWFDSDGILQLITNVRVIGGKTVVDYAWYLYPEKPATMHSDYLDKEVFHTYAPTAPEILEALGINYALAYGAGEPTLIHLGDNLLPFIHRHPDNAVECCAPEWLKLHSK